MSTPTLDEQHNRMEHLSAGELKAERLRERAAALRRRTPHPALVEDGAASRPRPLVARRPEREAADRERGEGPRDEPHGRGPEVRRHALKGVRERADQQRADEVLSSVRTSGWWDRATAGDLESARKIANESGTPAASRTAIRDEMREVAQRRYGTSVDGAIRYERENPYLPPPDLRSSGGRVLI